MSNVVKAIDPTRLYSALLNTGLQNKDNPTYQVIYGLIQQLVALNAMINSGTIPSGGPSTVTNINQTIQQLSLLDDGGQGGISGSNDPMFPPGTPPVSVTSGTDAFVPYFIASGDTFTVPIYKQGLFAMNIDNEGTLVVDGYLIEVDGNNDPDAIRNAVSRIPPGNLYNDENNEILYQNFINTDPNELVVSTTGTIIDLDFGNAALIRFTNATDSTLRGLKAGRSGQLVGIVSDGAGHVYLSNNNGAPTNDGFQNFITNTYTPLAAGSGTALFQYDTSAARWRLIHHCQGKPINVTFSAGDFTASGAMTWTLTSPDIVTHSYYVEGDLITVFFAAQTTTVGGVVSTTLNVACPSINGSLAGCGQSSVNAGGRVNDNGTETVGLVFAVATGSIIQISKYPSLANYTLATNNTIVQFTFRYKTD